jgi:hypothetical protein
LTTLTVLDSEEKVESEACREIALAGTRLLGLPDGRVLAPAFRGYAVDLGRVAVPDDADDDAISALVVDYVETLRAHDWTSLRGVPLTDDRDWLDLRGAMVRTGWGPEAAQAAWRACRERPYSRDLPTAAGWAAAGWVVPAGSERGGEHEPEPAFARPVLETRGLLRWAYLDRWREPPEPPDTTPPVEAEPADAGWADVLSRLRQDHYTEQARDLAGDLAVTVLNRAGLGPRDPVEAEDEPLPDRDLDTAAAHPSPVVRTAAWWLLRDEAEEWMACAYNQCQHHLAIEAEEDAFEQEEVLELAALGVANPVDAAYQRRRLLTLAFGDVSDVPLAGAGDLEAFVAFYTDWVNRGRPEEELQRAAEELRGDA